MISASTYPEYPWKRKRNYI